MNMLQFLAFFFPNLQFPGTTSGKAGKIAKKTLGNLRKSCEKMQNNCNYVAKYLQNNQKRRQNSEKKNMFANILQNL